ncbi:glycosyltransferase family 4 protein [Paenibacillus sp. JDR-2]|uniref:glycosyltransferase family 4 protein n=1 Tax=Paenibacillus sp. (strain JDR-2) TaxID=324057 RepID=UPI0001667CC9|nr:glycosyltransferase family 4 protein [Paenibacillus sp. JDR-2]ACT04363.1 glycosyl transferase group 1 [Paenibacillus sp. JDR-2]
MLRESIQKLRSQEYIDRVKRLIWAEKQQLNKKTNSRNKQEPIHVVYVLNHVGVCGGVKIIFEHANGLQKLGARVTLVSHFPKPDWFPIETDYICVPFEIELANGIPDCDVIVATYWEHVNACVGMGIAPVVYFEQGDFHLFEDEGVSKEISVIVKKQYQMPAYILAVSGQISKIIHQKYERQSTVCQNALNSSLFYGKKTEATKKSMIIVGSEQAAFKGIKDLKAVYKAVLSKGYDIELIWITQHQPAEPLGRVYVSPSQEQIADLYREAFVYVSGSYYESFPLPPLEAMACGTPVVTTENVGVMEYAEDEYNCLIAQIGDIEKLTDNIVRLLEDQELYRELQENGYHTSSNYEWNAILTELLNYYEEIADYEVAPLYSNEHDWNRVYGGTFLADKNTILKIDRFLSHSMANEVFIPVEYEFIPGISVVRWEMWASRKSHIDNGYSDKLYVRVKGLGQPKDDKYKEIADLFLIKKYKEALYLLKDKLQSISSDSMEYPICVRWIVLCYIELELDSQALALLESTLPNHMLNTDLVYLYGTVLQLMGNSEMAKQAYDYCLYIQDAAYYPEYFGNLRERILLTKDEL